LLLPQGKTNGGAGTGERRDRVARRGQRQETSGNVLPHGGDSAGGEIAMPSKVALNFAQSHRRSYTILNRLMDNGPIDHSSARTVATMYHRHKHIAALRSRGR